MTGQTTKRQKKNSSKLKVVVTGVLLVFSLLFAVGISRIPQELRQFAQSAPTPTVPARITTPPQCAAAGNDSGICVATATDSCNPGEEVDEGQLDCGAGQTCCALAQVPPQCAATSNGQSFCSTATFCTSNGYTDKTQLDCGTGFTCCLNPAFPTPIPGNTTPSQTEIPTPTFGSISVPSPKPTAVPVPPTAVPTTPPAPPAQPAATDQGGFFTLLITILIFIIKLIGF